jgi:NAD-dependent SIR2 family protein deacetylase
MESRAALQLRLIEQNPRFLDQVAEIAPDGDADLEAQDFRDFVVPRCRECSGLLKPNVVFFGEGVKKRIVDEAFSLLAESDALLIVGSSVTVFSGYRFVRRAVKDQIPIFVANIGATRADAVASHVVRGIVGEVLTDLALDASRLRRRSIE